MNKKFTSRRELLRHAGDASQIFGIKDYALKGGKAEGVRAMDVKSGAGLEFTVLPDRCLDIAWLSYKGSNFSYISKTGVTASPYYEKDGYEWFRSFYAGFLTTCGIAYAGVPCTDEGEGLGLHGRISNTPAEQVCASTEWSKDGAVMKIKGFMREASVHREHLILERELICNYGENKIYINDTVENRGFKAEPLQMLYHFNLGYPLLDAKSYLIMPSTEATPRNANAKIGHAVHDKGQPPTPGFKEQAFFHNITTADKNGRTCGALVNPELELGVAIWFNKKQLPRLTQWRMLGEGEYVIGIEPCNCIVEGRAQARQEGSLEFIKPGEIRRFNIEVEIMDSMKRIKEIEAQVKPRKKNNMELKGKTAIITGGGRGIGKAIALDLAKEGCNIAVSSRNEKELDEVVKEARNLNVQALALPFDLSMQSQIASLVDRTFEHFHSIDILINNAGIAFAKPLLEVTLEEWDETMSINLRSAFMLSQKVLAIMKEKRSGYIVNISSTVAHGVPPQLAAYGASKAGMVGLAQALYETAKDFGVKVSTVYPGITDTKMVRDLNPPTRPEQWMLPEDISYCVMFLLKQSRRMVVRDITPWSTGYDRI